MADGLKQAHALQLLILSTNRISDTGAYGLALAARNNPNLNHIVRRTVMSTSKVLSCCGSKLVHVGSETCGLWSCGSAGLGSGVWVSGSVGLCGRATTPLVGRLFIYLTGRRPKLPARAKTQRPSSDFHLPRPHHWVQADSTAVPLQRQALKLCGGGVT